MIKQLKKRKTKRKRKQRKPIVTFLAALGVTLLGVILLFMEDETVEYLLVLIVSVSLLMGGVSFMIQGFQIKRYAAGILGLGAYLLTGIVLVLLEYYFGVISLAPTFFPLENFAALRYFVSFYLIIYAITIFGDFYAEVTRSELEEDRMHRRMHIALPNLITAFKIKRMVHEICRGIEENEVEKKIYVEDKENSDLDTVNLEINLHLTDPKGNQFGHMDIAIGDTVYSYGTYDKSKNKLAGFVSQGTYAEIPKLPYYKYCIDNCGDYLISYGASFSEKQLQTVRDRLAQFKEYCEPLTFALDHPENNVPEPGKRYGDSGEDLVRYVNAKIFTVVGGSFKSYFGVNVNCVQFADWLLGDTGIDAVSLGGLRTPGAFYYMLENMFHRPKNRIIRKISYFSTEHIDEIIKLGSNAN